jgi:hypothetical protein
VISLDLKTKHLPSGLKVYGLHMQFPSALGKDCTASVHLAQSASVPLLVHTLREMANSIEREHMASEQAYRFIKPTMGYTTSHPLPVMVRQPLATA